MKTFKFLFLICLNFMFGGMLAAAAGFNPAIGAFGLSGAQLTYSALVPQTSANMAFAPVGFTLTGLNAALGAYCRKFEQQIMRAVFQDVQLEKYTRKVSGVSDEYAVASSSSTEVLQAYQKAWTPKGDTAFTAVVNKVRQIKIDYEIDEIDALHRSYLHFMADENKSRKDWPFVRYVVQFHIVPQIASEIDYNSWNGVYVAPTPGTAGNSVDTVDGFGKVIADLITATTITPIATGAITSSNIVDRVEFFVDSLPNLYKNIDTPILMSTSNARAYYRDYRASFGANANYSGKDNLKVDATNKMIIGINAMEGSDRFVHTTKNNMLTMFDKIGYPANLETQLDKRVINLLGSFKRGYGFGIAEEVFVNDQA